MRYSPYALFTICSGSVLLCALCPFIGLEWISPAVLWSGNETSAPAQILLKLRIPRVLLAALTGAALAVGGLVFQGVFRNILATPFTLGVTSGAAFGAALYFKVGVYFGLVSVAGSSIFAFAGALLTIILVYSLARFGPGFSSVTILLSGVVVSFFFSSLIVFIQYVSDFNAIFRITRWLMGGFDVVGFDSIWLVIPFVAVGLGVITYYIRALDLLALGDELALARGVSVNWVRNALFLATSLMIGGVVAFSGPIGFVGLMVPHVCRLLLGYRHQQLFVASIFLGAAFLAVCDTLARTIIAPYEIPVGVLTALLGGPFFLWILLGRQIKIRDVHAL